MASRSSLDTLDLGSFALLSAPAISFLSAADSLELRPPHASSVCSTYLCTGMEVGDNEKLRPLASALFWGGVNS